MTSATALRIEPSTELPSVELNNILQKLDLTFLHDKMLAMPTRYYISVSVVCDIVCPFCPRQYFGENVDNGVMNYEAFTTVAPHLKYADFAGMFGLGEPFLHKDFFNFLEQAKRTGCYTTSNSHGMSLTEENCTKLIESGIDQINCSMDGPNKEVFEFLREGAVFETVVENLKNFTALKKKMGVDHPELQIAVTVSRHNMKWMPDMVKLAKSVGAESITFTNLIIVDPDNMDLSVVNTPIFEKHLNKAMKLADKYGIRNAFFFQNPFPWMLDEDEVIEPDGKHYGCHEAWRALTIERRGDAKPCCYWEGYIGNAFEKPIDELRNSDEYLELRHELMEGRLNVFCANCGNLRVVTRESAEGRINEAEEMLGAAESLTDDQQEWVRELIGQYRELAAQLPA